MKKHLLVALSGMTLLTACETVSELKTGASNGVANLASCSQISSTFAAYDRDRQSFSALSSIAQMVNVDTSKMDQSKPSSYYENVKTGANLALMLQGCQPIE